MRKKICSALILFHPLLGWIVGARGVILHTEDGGQTWQFQKTNTFSWLEDVGFTDMQHGVAVGSNGTILRTEDAGENWKRVDKNLREWLYAVAFADDQRGYAVGA